MEWDVLDIWDIMGCVSGGMLDHLHWEQERDVVLRRALSRDQNFLGSYLK